MRPAIRLTALALLLAGPSPAVAEGDAKIGAKLYRACVACHSLLPDVHLTGPSLHGMWGRQAASVGGFPRYSPALKARDFIWDEVTLNAWIADPNAFVEGSSMTFRGIKDESARRDLIAFLRIAMAPGGAEAVVAQGLLPERLARGPVPEPLNRAPPEHQVVSIRHCRSTFFVATADGTERPIWEFNLRLKVDSSAAGPTHGKPVLVRSGMQGDRASLVFSDPAQISAFVQKGC